MIDEKRIEGTAQKLMAYNFHMMRMLRGMSQKEIADHLKKSPNAVSNWELGNTSPSIDDLISLCDLLRISPNELLGWDECDELEDYIRQSQGLTAKMEELKRQKKEIDEQIKALSQQINRKK